MGTKLHQLRVDDEVWDSIQALRGIFGTVNAGLRMKFGLSPKPGNEVEQSVVPSKVKDSKQDAPVAVAEGGSVVERELKYEMEDV